MWPPIKKFLLKSGLVALFVGIWFILCPTDHAHADNYTTAEQVIVDSATATIQQAETTTAVISSQSTYLIDSSTVTTSVESATAAISNAKTALSVYETATATQASAQLTVDSATATVTLKQGIVDTATATFNTAKTLVDSQTAIVASNQSLVDSATAVVNANTSPGLTMTVYSNPGTNASPTPGGTVVYTGTDTNGIDEQWGGGGPTVNNGTTTITETFNNNQLNTSIGITVNGTPVSTTNNNGVRITSIGWPTAAGNGSDPSLTLMSPTATTTITMPTGTTSAGFAVFAKNGNTTGLITYSDGTTENYVIQDDVNSQYPNYVHQETFTAPAGKTILTVTIPTDWDYFAVDNVSATKPNTTVVTEDFQVRWQGLWTPQTTGTQYITAPADDGVKLYLDGELVIDDWYDKGGGGSTADVATTAGLAKQFEMWYYENGGGAAVSLQRYTGSGWEVIPASEFSTSTATSTQLTTLANAKTTLNTNTSILNTYKSDSATASSNLNAAKLELETATATLNTAKITLSNAETSTATAKTNLDNKIILMNSAVGNAQQTLNSQMVINPPQNLTVTSDTSTVTLNWQAPTEGVKPERYAIFFDNGTSAGWGIATGNAGDANALNTTITLSYDLFKQTGGLDSVYNFSIRSDQDTLHMYSNRSNTVSINIIDYERVAREEAARIAAEQAAAEAARQASIAEANARAAEASALAAQAAAAKAQAEAQAAAEAAAKAEAEAQAAQEAQAKAEAEAKAAEEAAAKAEAEAKATEEANAKAEAEKAAAEAEAKAQAEADAKAEAEAKAAEAEAAKAEAEAKEQAAKDAKAQADAKEAEAKAAAEEAKQAIEDAKKATESGKELTKEEVKAVVAALVADLKPGESISAAEIKSSGVSFKDLPPSTPVEMRTSETGEVLVITAEVAANVELVQDPGALLNAALTDPGAALAALGSIGADMTPGEREEATHMVVATVVATGAALNAVSLATGGGAPAGGGSTGGSSGGTNSGGTRRRNETW